MKLTALAVALPFLVALPMSASTFTVGTYTQTSCYPFGCGPNDGLTNYQQLYRAYEFGGSGALDITSLSFFSVENPGGLLGQGSYDIYLSSTSSIDLFPPFSGNRGADRTLFAHVAFSQYDGTSMYGSDPASCGVNRSAVYPDYPAICDHEPQTLTITGNSSFHYDPSSGQNLLLDIVMSEPVSGTAFYAWANLKSSAPSNDVLWNSIYYSTQRSGFLVTEFAFDSATPEPGTYLLFASGLALVAAYRRYRGVMA